MGTNHCGSNFFAQKSWSAYDCQLGPCLADRFDCYRHSDAVQEKDDVIVSYCLISFDVIK